MYCRNCGSKLPDNAKFCQKCGSKIINNVEQLNTDIIKQQEKGEEYSTTEECNTTGECNAIEDKIYNLKSSYGINFWARKETDVEIKGNEIICNSNFKTISFEYENIKSVKWKIHISVLNIIAIVLILLCSMFGLADYEFGSRLLALEAIIVAILIVAGFNNVIEIKDVNGQIFKILIYNGNVTRKLADEITNKTKKNKIYRDGFYIWQLIVVSVIVILAGVNVCCNIVKEPIQSIKIEKTEKEVSWIAGSYTNQESSTSEEYKDTLLISQNSGNYSKIYELKNGEVVGYANLQKKQYSASYWGLTYDLCIIKTEERNIYILEDSNGNTFGKLKITKDSAIITESIEMNGTYALDYKYEKH